jgi:hypothetical protein
MICPNRRYCAVTDECHHAEDHDYDKRCNDWSLRGEHCPACVKTSTEDKRRLIINPRTGADV